MQTDCKRGELYADQFHCRVCLVLSTQTFDSTHNYHRTDNRPKLAFSVERQWQRQVESSLCVCVGMRQPPEEANNRRQSHMHTQVKCRVPFDCQAQHRKVRVYGQGKNRPCKMGPHSVWSKQNNRCRTVTARMKQNDGSVGGHLLLIALQFTHITFANILVSNQTNTDYK